MSNNYAFIDSQNLNMATHTLGWNMDWAKFRAFLKQEFGVDVAYLFMGYMPEHQEMYSSLQKAGYIVVFKPVSVNREGEVKGNIDAELVLQTMIDFERYDGALIVTGDGDFASLVSHLCNKNKLAGVLIPNQRQFSPLLKSAAKDKIFFINNLRRELEYRRYNNHKPTSRVENPDARSSSLDTGKPSESTGTKVIASSPVAPNTYSGSTTPTPSAPPRPVNPQQPQQTPVESQPARPSSRPASQGSRGRGTSTRSLEDSIIQATSTPAETAARKPRPSRRPTASDKSTNQG
jgi:uncharacterized LabA/DUF88 family protein